MTGVHLACLAEGVRAAPRERRRARGSATRLVAQLNGMISAAKLGLELHDRRFLARISLLRKLDRCRSTSRLPDLIEYVVTRPIASGASSRGNWASRRGRRKISSPSSDGVKPRGEDDIGHGEYCGPALSSMGRKGNWRLGACFSVMRRDRITLMGVQRATKVLTNCLVLICDFRM